LSVPVAFVDAVVAAAQLGSVDLVRVPAVATAGVTAGITVGPSSPSASPSPSDSAGLASP